MKTTIMKQYIVTALLMLVANMAWADGYKVNITNGSGVTASATTDVAENAIVTLTVTTGDSKYIETTDIIVIKTAGGSSAQSRRRSPSDSPSIAEQVTVAASSVNAQGAGTYTFTMPASNVEVSATFHDRTTLTDEMFDNLAAVTYTGTAHEPAISVASGYTLTLNADYSVSYTNNTNAGTGHATITGVGKYMGEVMKDFTINPAALEVTADNYSGTYDGTAHGITVTAEAATIKYREGDTGEYNLTEAPTLTNVGTETVYYQVTKDNYETVTDSKTITITAKELTADMVTLSETNFTYNGQVQKPTVTVADGGIITENDYDITNEGGTTAGTYDVVVTAKGNYQLGEGVSNITKQFTIANPTAECGNGLTYSYDPESNTVTISKTGDGDGAMTNFTTESPAPWKDYVDENTTVIIEDGVTSIGENAFNDEQHTPATVFVPSSVTTTAEDAISGNADVYNYTKDGNDITITNYTGSDDPVTIPTKIGNEDVSAVNVESFTGEGAPSTVLIPEGIATTGTLPETSETDFFTYEEETVGENTTATIKGYVGNSDVVEIPATIGGNNVTDIAAGAFTGNNSQPATILIPDGITVANNATDPDETTQLTYQEDGNDITITDIEGSADEIVIPAKVGDKDITSVDVSKLPTGDDKPSTVLIPTGVATTGDLPANTDVFAYTEQTDEQTGEPTGNLTITDYIGNNDVVAIPTSVGGKDVAEIAAGAFTGNNSKPTTILIPDNGNGEPAVTLAEGATVDNTAMLTYEPVKNQQEEVTGMTITSYTGSGDVLEIPATIGGQPVTGIKDDVFTGENAPATVFAPSTVNTEGLIVGGNTNLFAYQEVEDQQTGETTATITGYAGNSDVVEIPTKIGNTEVTKIEGDDFKGENAPTVIVPKTVADNSEEAFGDDSSLLTYEKDADTGEITIKGYTGNDDVVTIPTTIDGGSVTGIDQNVFTGENAPKTVLVPESVTDSEGAFADNTDQFVYKEETDGTTGETTATITGYTGNSEVVEVPTTIGGKEVTKIDEGTFTGPAEGEEGSPAPSTVLVPNTVTESDGAFDNDKTDQFTYIEQKDNQGNTTGVTITGYTGNSDVVEVPTSVGGNDVTTVAEGAFTGGTDSPATVLVPDGTTVEDGALPASTSQLTYKEETDTETGEKSIEITGYTGGTGATSVEIPAEIGGTPVTTIADDAFDNADNLQEVTLPETVNEDVSELANVEVTQEMGGGITMKTKTEGNTKRVNITEPETVSSTNYSKPIPATIAEASLTYTRTLTKSAAATASNMYTVCLPYTPPMNGNLKYYTLSTGESDVLTFTEVTEPAANTPYLVVVSDNVSVGSEAQPVNLNTAIGTVGDATATDGYQLCGTLRGMTHDEAVMADAYILQSDGTWKKVTDTADENKNAYIPPFRAYIVKTTSGSGARLYSVISDETPTGIDDTSRLMNNEETAKDGWYTLDGRLVNGKPSQKGVYVKANRKIVVNK